MFQPPSWITMSIAATRMHRSLVDYTSGSADMYDIVTSFRSPTHRGHRSFSTQGSLEHNNVPPMAPRTRRISAAPTSLDRMEVAVHVISEQHISRQISSDDSCIDTYEPGKREAQPVKPGWRCGMAGCKIPSTLKTATVLVSGWTQLWQFYSVIR